jgi:hypothetical protein
MKKKKIGVVISFLLFLATLGVSAEMTILKNVSLFRPDGSFQQESFIILKGCKINKTGLMKELGEGIFDNEYDLQGSFVYPAFIDPLYMGFQEKAAEEEEREKDTKNIESLESKDREKREPFEERKLFIKRNVLDVVQIKKSGARKLVAGGFTMIHVVPNQGVINGTSGVISLVSEELTEAVVVPEKFMFLPFKTNSRSYPTTHASLMAELMQLREDSLYHQKMKKLQFFHESQREKYMPELDILLPYFTGEKRFLMMTRNIVEQRMVEILRKKLKINPVIVASPDVWRRKVAAGADIILPLKFKPPLSSRYSQLGDKIKKEAGEKIYPEKIAEFFKTHDHVCLTAPDSGDYKTLVENIRILMKNGVSEAAIIKSLTQNPAKLLDISGFAGSIKPGLLANLVVCDKKIFEEKAKITKVFVEGKLFDFKTREGDGKPPVTNLTGKWKVKIESPMGSFDVKMTLEQEGNDLTGTISSPDGSLTDIQEGYISGDEVFITLTIDVGGQDITLEISAKVKGKKLEGTISIGSFGEGNFAATPENL